MKNVKKEIYTDNFTGPLIPHAEFYLKENLESFLDCFRKALEKRGLCRKLYVDNGPSYRAHQLTHVCACLGIALIHCTPYEAAGKGKIVMRSYRHLTPSFPNMQDVFSSPLSSLLSIQPPSIGDCISA